jgi:phosphate transport system protein
MAAEVHQAVESAVAAFAERDTAGAHRVVEGDDAIDSLMVEIEERCYEVLARHQPVASDLRLVTSVLRVVVDLERCGDLAVALAKQVENGFPREDMPSTMRDGLTRMGELSAALVESASQAWAHRDVAQAISLEGRDDKVDALHTEIMRQLPGLTGEHAPEIAAQVALAGRFIERIADHAVCIGERVHYLVKGHPESLALEVGP